LRGCNLPPYQLNHLLPLLALAFPIINSLIFSRLNFVIAIIPIPSHSNILLYQINDNSILAYCCSGSPPCSMLLLPIVYLGNHQWSNTILSQDTFIHLSWHAIEIICLCQIAYKWRRKSKRCVALSTNEVINEKMHK
jgi:hypothetical protein